VTDTKVFQLSQPGTFCRSLTEVLRNGARTLLAQAVKAEVSSLLSCHADTLTCDGRRTRDTDFNQFPFLEVIDPLRP